jgi:hypothetical protein
MTRKILGDEVEQDIFHNHTNYTFHRIIANLSFDMEDSFQLHCQALPQKLTNLRIGETKLLARVHFIYGNEIISYCAVLSLQRTQEDKMFDTPASNIQFIWKSCVRICTDSAPSIFMPKLPIVY